MKTTNWLLDGIGLLLSFIVVFVFIAMALTWPWAMFLLVVFLASIVVLVNIFRGD